MLISKLSLKHYWKHLKSKGMQVCGRTGLMLMVRHWELESIVRALWRGTTNCHYSQCTLRPYRPVSLTVHEVHRRFWHFLPHHHFEMWEPHPSTLQGTLPPSAWMVTDFLGWEASDAVPRRWLRRTQFPVWQWGKVMGQRSRFSK